LSTLEIAAVVLIVGIRGLVPLTLLRWPFWGALACIVGDISDSTVQDVLGVNVLGGGYHGFDKAFDTYYLAFEAAIAWKRWDDGIARSAASALFTVRLIAAVAFEITGMRPLFLVGANVFENFYLYIAGRREIDASYRVTTRRNLLFIIALVAMPKLMQEYVMHFREAQTWHFVTRHILMPWKR
jgi:hypothetical protein